MALQYLILAFVLCSSGSSAAATVRDDSLNQYIDLVLDNVQIMIVNEGFDPAVLPNSTMAFNRTIMGVTWFGEAGLYDGWIAGISTIERKGNVLFLYDAEGKVTGIECKMTIVSLKAHYKSLVTFMDLGPKLDITARVKGVDVWFQAKLFKDSCRFQASALEVLRIGHISMDITGLGLLNWLFEMMYEFVANIIRLFIRNMIEDTVQNIMNQALYMIDLTPVGFFLDCDPQVDRYPPQNTPRLVKTD
ncbi:uncharacterized protein LOC143033461 [Oratosquilla oratoria]|uniref:uncharacterized protein LOC143033461 n=1 Tax=Oratosquilla oratoria TaxID=337810 RepID=UPI003F776B7D